VVVEVFFEVDVLVEAAAVVVVVDVRGDVVDKAVLRKMDSVEAPLSVEKTSHI
jgi:hypothetical protein